MSACLSGLRLHNYNSKKDVFCQDFHAFSQTQKATLKSGLASTDVEMTMISGDYFTFHPLPIRTGWYFSESELMRDRIILDRQTAWDLFYSDNVVGQALEWDGQKYVVAAVVDTEPGEYNDMAAGDTQRAWAFADAPAADGSCAESVQAGLTDGYPARSRPGLPRPPAEKSPMSV